MLLLASYLPKFEELVVNELKKSISKKYSPMFLFLIELSSLNVHFSGVYN